MRRVVITGIGVVGPTGVGIEAFWHSVLRGRSAIRRISRFDTSGYACQIGGEIPDQSHEDLLDSRKIRTTAHVTQLALAATQLALRDAFFDPKYQDPDLLGVCIGTAVGGWRDAEQQHVILMERGARRVNPFISNGTPNHTVGAEVASAVNAQGSQFTFSSGCPSSLQAIGHGAGLVASGELDICLAGGAESPLTPTILAGMARTHELSTLNDDPEGACRPFDQEHSGLVLSEGSCILVLESADHAMSRRARAYAEVRGCVSSCDANGMYGLDATGAPGARAIHRLLARTGMDLTDIDYVCAHANSSPAFDRKEVLVLKKAFGESASRMPVTSIKGVLGHPLGASGAFQSAATALAIRDQVIPPTHNLKNPDPECLLDHVTGSSRPADIGAALLSSYGYGGVNAYLILARP